MHAVSTSRAATYRSPAPSGTPHPRHPGLLEEAANLVHDRELEQVAHGQRDLGVDVVRRRLEEGRAELPDERHEPAGGLGGHDVHRQPGLQVWFDPVIFDPANDVAGGPLADPLVHRETRPRDHVRVETLLELGHRHALGTDRVARLAMGERVREDVQDAALDRVGDRLGRATGRTEVRAPRRVQQGEFGAGALKEAAHPVIPGSTLSDRLQAGSRLRVEPQAVGDLAAQDGGVHVPDEGRSIAKDPIRGRGVAGREGDPRQPLGGPRRCVRREGLGQDDGSRTPAESLPSR